MPNRFEGVTPPQESKGNAEEKIDAKSFKEVQDILKEVKESVERIFRGEPINPEAAVFNYARFKEQMFRISDQVRRAREILEKTAVNASHFIANTGCGWISELSKSDFEREFEVKNIKGIGATEESKEAWVNYCQRFFDEAKGLKNLFETAYMADD